MHVSSLHRYLSLLVRDHTFTATDQLHRATVTPRTTPRFLPRIKPEVLPVGARSNELDEAS